MYRWALETKGKPNPWEYYLIKFLVFLNIVSEDNIMNHISGDKALGMSGMMATACLLTRKYPYLFFTTNANFVIEKEGFIPWNIRLFRPGNVVTTYWSKEDNNEGPVPYGSLYQWLILKLWIYNILTQLLSTSLSQTYHESERKLWSSISIEVLPLLPMVLL